LEKFSLASLCGKKSGGSLDNFQPADAYGQKSSGPNPNKVRRHRMPGEKLWFFPLTQIINGIRGKVVG
jgi:hypothetical protein